MCKSITIKFLSGDASQCMGCRNCELACATRKAEASHKKGFHENQKIVPNIIIGQNQKVKIPGYCRHCSPAFCQDLCPKKAITRKNEVIMLEQDKCSGCGICEQVCPFGVITMGTWTIDDKTKKIAHKCDMCFDRQSGGEEPACYAACPTKALQLV